MSDKRLFSVELLRDKLNFLIEQHGEGTLLSEGLKDFAEELQIQLKPRKLEIEGRIFAEGKYSIYLENENKDLIRLIDLISDKFEFWGAMPVKLTIEEKLD